MYWLTAPAPGWATSTGLLVVRLVTGAAFVLHGWPKMQNPTGWMGAENAPPGFLQATAAVIEVGGGALLVLGLLTRVAALALVAQMVAALALVHIPHGDPFVGAPGKPSAELACAYLAVSLLTAITGAGAWSLDAVLFGRQWAVSDARLGGPSPALTSP
jgi:putative oxidoreductase